MDNAKMLFIGIGIGIIFSVAIWLGFHIGGKIVGNNRSTRDIEQRAADNNRRLEDSERDSAESIERSAESIRRAEDNNRTAADLIREAKEILNHNTSN